VLWRDILESEFIDDKLVFKINGSNVVFTIYLRKIYSNNYGIPPSAVILDWKSASWKFVQHYNIIIIMTNRYVEQK